MRTKRNLKSWLVMAVLLVGMAPAIAAGGTIYVDDDADGKQPSSRITPMLMSGLCWRRIVSIWQSL